MPVMEFIRRYMLHVLPHGFMRIRYYGFMSPGCSIEHRRPVALVRLAQGFEVEVPETRISPVPELQCPHCGTKLRFLRISAAPGAGEMTGSRRHYWQRE